MKIFTQNQARRVVLGPSVMGAAMLALLSACAGGSVYGNYAANRYIRDHVRIASTEAPIQAVIRGNPFAGDARNEAILAHMQPRNSDVPLTLRQDAPTGANSGYKIVLLFGRTVDPQANACANTSPAISAAPAGRIEITASFCAREMVLSQVMGAMAMPASAQDGDLHALIGQVMNGLLRPPMQNTSTN
jgi:hypothetical protein